MVIWAVSIEDAVSEFNTAFSTAPTPGTAPPQAEHAGATATLAPSRAARVIVS
jgi:ribosomal protein L12E/L44/L45/RPP1/RPP2